MALAASAISSTWRSPITPRVEGNPTSITARTLPGLPSARGVIALWEVVEMARPHLGDLPPGEGMFLLVAP